MSSVFDDSSVIRSVQRERIMALWGPRALLVQAAHPVVFEGFFAASAALDDPYPRLQRTAQVLDTIVWGEQETAEIICERVRNIHSKVRGTLKEEAGRFSKGTQYRADDPEHLLWVLAGVVDSVIT